MKWGIYKCRLRKHCEAKHPGRVGPLCEHADDLDAEGALQAMHNRHICRRDVMLIDRRTKLEDAEVAITFAERGLHDDAEEFFRKE
jgi:hypothetical protein